MPLTEKKKISNERYLKSTFDEMKVRVPKGRKAEIQAAAENAGQSLNGFVTTAIDRHIEHMEKSKK